MKKYVMMSIVIFFLFGYLMFGLKPKYTEEYLNSKSDINQLSKSSDSGCMMLTYHHVKNDNVLYKLFNYVPQNNNDQVFNVYLSDFKQQMDELAQKKIPVLSIDEMMMGIKEKNLPDKCVVISFDDIDQTVYDNAYPILKEHDFPFTLFVIMNKMGNKYDAGKYATEDQIRAMKQSGLATIGLHTYDMHKSKGGTAVFNDKENIAEFKQDTNQSIKAYEASFKEKPKYFAYPYGFGNPKTDRVLLDEGINGIFTLRLGVIDKDTLSFYVPRVLVTKLNFPIVVDWLSK